VAILKLNALYYTKAKETTSTWEKTIVTMATGYYYTIGSDSKLVNS